jgi:hypothetical protein
LLITGKKKEKKNLVTTIKIKEERHQFIPLLFPMLKNKKRDKEERIVYKFLKDFMYACFIFL